MLQAGKSKAVDMFLNSPIIDINRNALLRSPEKAPQAGIDRMNRFWGGQSWRQAAYVENDQHNLFFGPELVKQSNDAVVKAFQEHCGRLLPMRCYGSRPPEENRVIFSSD
jgi:hypothetical protein